MHTKRIIGYKFLTALLLGITQASLVADYEQLDSLDKILEAIEDANGGRDSILEAKSLRVLGNIESGENVFDFVLLKKRPDKMKITMMYKGRVVETGFDGTVGWRRSSTAAGENVEILSRDGDSIDGLDTDFDGPLIGDPSPETERKYLGKERIGRVEYYKIEILGPGSKKSVHYIDTRTFREFKTKFFKVIDGEEELQSESTYDDYIRINGIWLAKRIERKLPDKQLEVITIKDAEINQGIFNTFFEAPTTKRVPTE